MIELGTRTVLTVAFVLCSWLPSWWFAGRIGSKGTEPFLRLLLSVGLTLTGYVTCVNLLGRLLENSFWAIGVYLALSLTACALLIWRKRSELGLASVVSSWRAWLVPLVLAIVFAIPQWFFAASTNFWDETNPSAIHLTAPNQFAEGLFPPRHNALPDIPIKYHYGFTILSGTVELFAGTTANVSVDLASTTLWLFIFLFVFFWLKQLGLGRWGATWGSLATLLGGGLAWLYVPWLETYGGFSRIPDPSQLRHSYQPDWGWLDNLGEVLRNQNAHLLNADGSFSSLPLDIANHFQQHAVPPGIAFTLVAGYLFWLWQTRDDHSPPLFLANILCFGLISLGHSVFGVVACFSAGLVLVARWFRRSSFGGVFRISLFTAGVTLVAFAHGGFLAMGDEYGEAGMMTLRDKLGWSEGGVLGFVNWNLAGFGLPLLLVPVALWACFRNRDPESRPANLAIAFFSVFGLVSFMVPQLIYYSSGSSKLEQATEVSKFFFCTHLSIGVLSAFAIPYLIRRTHWLVLVPAVLAMVITPVAVCYASAFDQNNHWKGFYYSPYEYRPGLYQVEIGKALRALKASNRDAYFDSSGERQGFINELLVFGGSVFTTTPSHYERSGSGYRLASEVVAERYVVDGRMARLLPGAPAEADCQWFYTLRGEDFAFMPVTVRSRFDKLVAEGYFVPKASAGPRTLYAIEKPTHDSDFGIELFWRPKMVTQTRTDWDGDGNNDLLFFDYVGQEIVTGSDRIHLPNHFERRELPLVYVANLAGDGRVDLLLGRMADTYYRMGESLTDLIHFNGYFWTPRESGSDTWQAEHPKWLWHVRRVDIPIIADLDNDGFDSRLAYRAGGDQWSVYPNRSLEGPSMARNQLPLPVAGRFLSDSAGDLGLWSSKSGKFVFKSVEGEGEATFEWEESAGGILVPGDYDGDGYDEMAVWQRGNTTWYVREALEGPVSQSSFGSITGVPLPADYDDDGRLDLAYWEPSARKIYVSYDFGQTVGQEVPVPPYAIPAFVNMY